MYHTKEPLLTVRQGLLTNICPEQTKLSTSQRIAGLQHAYRTATSALPAQDVNTALQSMLRIQKRKMVLCSVARRSVICNNRSGFASFSSFMNAESHYQSQASLCSVNNITSDCPATSATLSSKPAAVSTSVAASSTATNYSLASTLPLKSAGADRWSGGSMYSRCCLYYRFGNLSLLSETQAA